MLLKDKVALVTGAARGLGRDCCLKLAAEGAVVVAADINIDGVKETAAEINAGGGRAIALRVDVSDEQDTVRMVRDAIDAVGRVDILVNNAAVLYGLVRRPFFEISVDEWDRVMSVNIKGIWLVTKAIFPVMKENGGKIINIASEVFFTGSHGFVHYVASKGGVVGLTRALARELGDYNICINSVAPGFSDTESARDINPNFDKYDVDRNCIKRLALPSDIANAIAFFASDQCNFITGQTLLVNGGREMN